MSLPFNIDDNTEISFNIGSTDGSTYAGPYTVTPKTSNQTLQTASLIMTLNMTINKIGYYEVSNPKGTTIIIGDV